MSVKNKFPRILNFRNLDFEKLDYYQPQKTSSNTLISTVYYKFLQNNPIPIYLETPKLKTTSGIFKIDNEFYIDLELSLDGYNSSFYDFLSAIDEKNVVTCHYNSNEWFNQQLPFTTIEDFYKSPIRIKNNGSNPIFRLKIPTYRGKLMLEVFNTNKKIVNINKICKDDDLIAIIRFSGLKYYSKEFVAEWEICKIKLLKIIEEDILPTGYFFSDDTIEDTNNTEKLNEEKPIEEKTQLTQSSNIQEKTNNVFFNLEMDDINIDEITEERNKNNVVNENKFIISKNYSNSNTYENNYNDNTEPDPEIVEQHQQTHQKQIKI